MENLRSSHDIMKLYRELHVFGKLPLSRLYIPM